MRTWDGPDLVATLGAFTPQGPRDDPFNQTQEQEAGGARTITRNNTISRKAHQHKPLLVGNQIRLLVLYPARHLHAPLVCNLLQTSLDDIDAEASPYEAVVGWGSDKRDHEIVCDGRVTHVPTACQVALRYLRHKTKTRTLWVEVLCVDSSSLPERIHLELVLADIYRSAKDVLVWMGESDEHVQKVVRRVAFVGKSLRFVDDHAMKHPSSDAARFRKLFTPKFYKHFSTSAIPGRWFAKLLTLPEAVMERHPTLVTGYASIPWEDFKEWCNEYPKNDMQISASPRVSISKETPSPKPRRFSKRFSRLSTSAKLPIIVATQPTSVNG